MNQQIKLSLSLNDLNTILIALSERQYKEVVGTIAAIRAQADQQVQEITKKDQPIV